LDWTQSADLPTIDKVTTTPDDVFSGLNSTYSQMTYMVPKGATVLSSTELKKLNVLNPIWQRINKLMIGSQSDINIIRTFIMLEDTSQSTPHMILATMPGQYFSQELTSSEFSNFEWYKQAISSIGK